jgi:hypothetical protein
MFIFNLFYTGCFQVFFILAPALLYNSVKQKNKNKKQTKMEVNHESRSNYF